MTCTGTQAQRETTRFHRACENHAWPIQTTSCGVRQPLRRLAHASNRRFNMTKLRSTNCQAARIPIFKWVFLKCFRRVSICQWGAHSICQPEALRFASQRRSQRPLQGPWNIWILSVEYCILSLRLSCSPPPPTVTVGTGVPQSLKFSLSKNQQHRDVHRYFGAAVLWFEMNFSDFRILGARQCYR